MKKRLLAMGMALVMAVSLSTAAFADEATPGVAGTEDGQAAIEFEWSDDFVPGPWNPPEAPDGPYDPYDPEDPEQERPENPHGPDDLWGLESLDLDFGTRYINLITRDFYAYDRDGEYNGPDVAAAGVVVLSREDGWRLQVEIDEFMIAGEYGEVTPTILGYRLDLMGVGEITRIGLSNANDDFGVEGLFAGGDAATVWTGDRGGVGHEFAARLNVLGNTAHEGDAQADMVWTLAIGPVAD